MTRIPFLAALLAALPLGVTGAQETPRGWGQALSETARISVAAEPVTLTGELNGLALAGAWELSSDNENFGGLSGLLVDDDRLVAVSDRGWWFGARLARENGALALEDARLSPMRDPSGETYEKAGGDAEGLTRVGPRLAVSFERDHRIMMLRESGRLGATIQPRSFEQFPSNQGLEALAAMLGDKLIALAEEKGELGVPVFVVDPAGTAEESRITPPGDHLVTGADIGPDGRLYLVLRDYSITMGASIRVMRYALGPLGFPLVETAEVLAAFESADGIDNMEGIALDEGADGATRLWLISDDNFHMLQRTLLVQFTVLP